MASLIVRSRALCAATLSLVLATPASAAGFCDAIKAIAADTPNGFGSFRGAPAQPDSLYDHYAASGWPDGALSCQIDVATDEHIPNQAPYTSYTCNFPLGAPSKPAAMQKFAKSLQRCMGNLVNDGGPRPDKDGGSLTFSVRGTAGLGFAVITLPDSDMLRLNISNR